MTAGRNEGGGPMTVADGRDELPLGVWLRREREARGLARREMARRLIQAGRAAGVWSVPGIDSMCTNIRRWENCEVGLTERYRLYYCDVLGVPAAGLGALE